MPITNYIPVTPAEVLSVQKTFTKDGVPVIGITIRTNLLEGYQSQLFVFSMSNAERLLEDIVEQKDITFEEFIGRFNEQR